MTGVDDLATWLRAQMGEMALTADAMNHGSLRTYLLAEVDAKRRILDLHDGEDGCCYTCSDKRGDSVERAPCPTVCLLALPMAGRDGYREEWRP